MGKKIKILHVIPKFALGGAERLLVNLLEAFDHEKLEVAAVSLYSESGTIFEKEIKEKGLPVYFLNKHKGLDLRVIPDLYHLFRSYKPDVVHTHLYVLHYAFLAMLLCRVPVRIHTVHTIAQKEVDRIGKLIHWIVFRMGRVVPVSISLEVANTVRVLYGRGIRTPVIYNGIPTVRFVREAGLRVVKDGKNVVLLNIGRFVPLKGHLLLIEAFCLSIKEYPWMQLWLVGDGESRTAMEKAVSEKGLQGKISFLGIREDVPNLLAECDLFVLTSNYEGFSLTVSEAMAAGKPVVSTRVGGVPELIEDGLTGFLVPPHDSKALSQAILQLAKDINLRQKMGKAGQKKALKRFDISRTARGYEALYFEQLKECGKI